MSSCTVYYAHFSQTLKIGEKKMADHDEGYGYISFLAIEYQFIYLLGDIHISQEKSPFAFGQCVHYFRYT